MIFLPILFVFTTVNCTSLQRKNELPELVDPVPQVIFPAEGTVINGLSLVTTALESDNSVPSDYHFVDFEYSSDKVAWNSFAESKIEIDIWPFKGDWEAYLDTSDIPSETLFLRTILRSEKGSTISSVPREIVVNRAPTVSARATMGEEFGTVIFDSEGSVDRDGEISRVIWEFDDGKILEGKKVTRFFTSTTKTHRVTISTIDNLGLLSVKYFDVYFSAPQPPPGRVFFEEIWPCVCTDIGISKKGMALGPDAKPGGTEWPPHPQFHDGKTLGKISKNPGNTGTRLGMLFEVTATVKGVPSQCKEIQLVKNSIFVTFKDKSKKVIPFKWKGNKADLNLDGKNDIDAGDPPKTKTIEAPAKGNKYVPDDVSGNKKGGAYQEPFNYKSHVDDKAIWLTHPPTIQLVLSTLRLK